MVGHPRAKVGLGWMEMGWMEGEVLRFGEDGGRGGCWDGVGCDGIGWDLWG